MNKKNSTAVDTNNEQAAVDTNNEQVPVSNEEKNNSNLSNTASVASSAASSVIKPTGKVWNYMTKHVDESKDSMTIQCKFCSSNWKFVHSKWKAGGSATSNQMKHVNKNHPEKVDGYESSMILGPLNGYFGKFKDSKELKEGSVSDEMIRRAIENFIIRECEPFTIVESESFLDLVRVLLNCNRKDVFIPKADATKQGIIKRVESMKQELADNFKSINESRFHVVLDSWTSPNGYSFMAITTHWIDEAWNLRE